MAMAMCFGKAGSRVCTLDPGNTKGGSITVQLTSCLTGLELDA